MTRTRKKAMDQVLVNSARHAMEVTAASIFNNSFTTPPGIDVYQALSGEWHWQLTAKNHRILARSVQGYRTRYGAVRGLLATKRQILDLELEGLFRGLR